MTWQINSLFTTTIICEEVSRLYPPREWGSHRYVYRTLLTIMGSVYTKLGLAEVC